MSADCSNMLLQGLIITIFSLLYSCSGTTINHKKALYTNLTTDYNKDIPPITNQSDVIYVTVSLSVVSLNDIDEVSEKFSVSAFFTITWFDQSMVWNTGDYGWIYELRINIEYVWIPEIILINPTGKFKSLRADWNQIRYNSTGHAQWYPGDLIKASCTIDVYYFPFDTQVCDLQMQAYGYDTTEVKLVSNRDDIDISSMSAHSSWIISETKAYVIEAFGNSQAVFRFHFERRPQFVIVNVILPILFMCLLNVMVFLLPVDSGERIGFAITVLLAIAVYMTIVSDNLPKTSKPLPLISYLLIICLVVSVLITVVTVLNLRLFHKDSDEPVPQWLTRVYNALTCRVCLKRKGDKPTDNGKAKLGTDSGFVPSNKVGVLPHMIDDEQLKETTPVTWRDISTMVDYIALLVTTLSLIISFSVILLIARNSAN